MPLGQHTLKVVFPDLKVILLSGFVPLGKLTVTPRSKIVHERLIVIQLVHKFPQRVPEYSRG
jgi:hypothetical protein